MHRPHGRACGAGRAFAAISNHRFTLAFAFVRAEGSERPFAGRAWVAFSAFMYSLIARSLSGVGTPEIRMSISSSFLKSGNIEIFIITMN